MKFKIAIIGLLAAILATCTFTAYKLTSEAEKQTQLQIAQTEGIIAIMGMSDKAVWQVGENGLEPFILINGEDIKNGGHPLVTEVTDSYDKIKGILEAIQ